MSAEDEVLRGLAEAGVATVVYVLQKAGLYHCYLPLPTVTPDVPSLAGTARTLRCEPVREDVRDAQRGGAATNVHRAMFDSIRAGEVLVIAARGNRGAAIMGDVLAAGLVANGCAGVVTDGMVRDITALRQLGLPVFANGVHSSTFSTAHVAVDADVPVACSEVLICPGDYVIGDAEGLAVVPADRADEILAAARKQEAADVAALASIRAGGTVSDALRRPAGHA